MVVDPGHQPNRDFTFRTSDFALARQVRTPRPASALSCSRFSLSVEMSRPTRDGTAEPVSRDQIFRHARGQGDVHFPCSADHDQYWQPYPVDPYSAICDDHTYTCIHVPMFHTQHNHPQTESCSSYASTCTEIENSIYVTCVDLFLLVSISFTAEGP